MTRSLGETMGMRFLRGTCTAPPVAVVPSWQVDAWVIDPK